MTKKEENIKVKKEGGEEKEGVTKRPLKPVEKEQPVVKKQPKVEVSRQVILKLIGFSLALLFLPILSYYFTLHRIFNGETLYSALLAAFVANLVVGLYVMAAVWEDDTPDLNKKNQ